MRKSKTLARIRAGKTVRTCVLGHYIPAYVCHAARAGYDCIWLDLEHRALNIHQIQAMLAYSHLFDIDIMLRPPTLEKTGLYRFLEDGAAGLMIPHVATPDMAKMLVNATKFPPIGDRGIDNAGLDADFYVHDPDEYIAWANQETFLTVQIETPEAVRNADAIAATPGVDILFVGPGDLGLRLRQTREMTLDDAWQIVADACKKHGKTFGGPTMAPEEMNKRHAQGARFLVNCSEFQASTSALANQIGSINALD
jgi:4-hydroxy-2-oxoheptanedioate aldolase